MPIFNFPQFEHPLFWLYFAHLHAFLAEYDYCVAKWGILDIVDEGVNSKTRALLEYWVFMAKMLIKHGICLSGLLGIYFNLGKLVVFLAIPSLVIVHFIINLIMPLFGVTYVILLTMLLVRVFIIHVMLNLTSYYPGTILISS